MTGKTSMCDFRDATMLSTLEFALRSSYCYWCQYNRKTNFTCLCCVLIARFLLITIKFVTLPYEFISRIYGWFFHFIWLFVCLPVADGWRRYQTKSIDTFVETLSAIIRPFYGGNKMPCAIEFATTIIFELEAKKTSDFMANLAQQL